MLQFTRPGPRLMTLEGKAELADYLLTHLPRATAFKGLEDVSNWMGHHTAVICEHEGQKRYIKIEGSTGSLLATLVNDAPGLVTRVVRLPRIQLFRVGNEPEKAYEAVSRRFGGQSLALDQIFEPWSLSGLTLCFTQKNLRQPIGFGDVYPYVLRIGGQPEVLDEALGRQAFNLFNLSLGEKTWSVFDIKVYDAYGRYDVHRRRLASVLDELDLGLVLSEGWGRDYGRVLIPLQVYTFKVYTYLTASQMKRVLVGLESDDYENRLADLDLYEGKKKIDWGVGRTTPSQSRDQCKKECRDELLSALSSEAVQDLRESEKTLRALERKLGGRPQE